MHLTNIMPKRGYFGTPQNQMADATQVKNRAGGFTFAVNEFERLNRFLILGTEGGTFYAGERELTVENAKILFKFFQNDKDGCLAVDRIVEISDKGIAVKNDTAIFALAMAAGAGTPQVKRYALSKLNDVCRTGSHLLMFAKYIEQFRGWGRGLKTAVANWYLSRDADQLAFQVTKYANRNGYTQRDLLRLSHPQATDPLVDKTLGYVAGKDFVDGAEYPKLLLIVDQIKKNPEKVRLDYIKEYNLAREVLPTEWLQKPEVWEAMLGNMPITAMVRNLATMTRLGLLTERSEATNMVVKKLVTGDALRKSRIHPMSLLIALKTYDSGRGVRGSNTWIPSNAIVAALNEAFYRAYGNVEPTGKRLLIALDMSGSMTTAYGGSVMGIPGFSPREATAALATVQVNVESNVDVIGFSAKGYGPARDGFYNLQIGKDQSLERVLQHLSTFRDGGTDLSLPMSYAMQNAKDYDAVIMYTDNETWAGKTHVHEALANYRNRRGPVKLVVASTTATTNTVADPYDPLSLSLIGFDSSLPQAINEFIRN